MRISVVRGGGLAGIATVTELDSARLGDQARAELDAAVARVRPPAGAAAPAAAARGADTFSYQVTVDDGSARQTLHGSDEDPALRELVGLVMRAPERERRVLRPGEPAGS